MSGIVFRDNRGGYDEFLQRIKELGGKPYVLIGILADKGAAGHGDSGATILEIAEVHEFGAVIRIEAHSQKVYKSVNPDGSFRKGGRFVKKSKANYATEHRVDAYDIEIPARSFIAATVDLKRAQIAAKAKECLALYVAGKLALKKALAILGQFVVTLIQLRIQSGIAPPLAPSTIRQRAGGGQGSGGDTPLFDTAQLMRSVSYRVVGV